MTSNEKMIEKISKLMRLANDKSASQGEIENALMMASNLMRKHNISDDALLGFGDEIGSETIEVNIVVGEKVSWRWDLIDTIAKQNLCTTHSIKLSKCSIGAKGNYKRIQYYIVTIVGSEINRSVVKSMFNAVVDLYPPMASTRYNEHINEIVKKYVDSNPTMQISRKYLKDNGYLPTRTVFINSYYAGCISGIKNKIIKDKYNDSVSDSNKYALIIVKNNDLIEDFLKDIKLGKSKNRPSQTNVTAYKMGKDDASESNKMLNVKLNIMDKQKLLNALNEEKSRFSSLGHNIEEHNQCIEFLTNGTIPSNISSMLDSLMNDTETFYSDYEA